MSFFGRMFNTKKKEDKKIDELKDHPVIPILSEFLKN